MFFFEYSFFPFTKISFQIVFKALCFRDQELAAKEFLCNFTLHIRVRKKSKKNYFRMFIISKHTNEDESYCFWVSKKDTKNLDTQKPEKIEFAEICYLASL